MTEPTQFVDKDQPLTGLGRHPIPDGLDDTEGHSMTPGSDADADQAWPGRTYPRSFGGRTYPSGTEDVEAHVLSGVPPEDSAESPAAEPDAEAPGNQPWW